MDLDTLLAPISQKRRDRLERRRIDAEARRALQAEERIAPEPVGLLGEIGCDQEYIDLASDLGLESPSLFEAKFLKFAHEEGIHVYDHGQVHRYMRRISADAGMIYQWWPMRRIDLERLESLSDPSVNWAWPRWNSGSLMLDQIDRREPYGFVARSLYSKPIPYPALLTAKKIENRFKDENPILVVTEMVEEWNRRTSGDGDPFLGVLLGLSKLFVVERWDEPGFRER